MLLEHLERLLVCLYRTFGDYQVDPSPSDYKVGILSQKKLSSHQGELDKKSALADHYSIYEQFYNGASKHSLQKTLNWDNYHKSK